MVRVYSFCSLLVLAACAQPNPTPLEAHDGLSIDGPSAVLAALGRAGSSQTLALEGAALRLGLLWDGADPDAIEVRFSADSEAWSGWEVPVSVHDEGLAHAGFADAPPRAAFVQWRVREGRAAPDFLRLEEIQSLGEPEAVAEPLAIDVPGDGTRRDLLAAFPNILSRAAWGARAPTCSSPTSPYRSVIHHSATPTVDSFTPEQRLRQIQDYHMDGRGYCDIAYNFLMSRDARVWTGRGSTTLGAHTLNANTGNIALCYLGNYVGDQPTDAQVCAGAGWLAWLNATTGVAFSTLKGHRDYGQTECPGDLLYARLGEIGQKAQQGCAPPTPQYAAQFVSQTFPQAHLSALQLVQGAESQGSIVLKNVGTATWQPATTKLAPTPRDVASPLVGTGWLSATRIAHVAAPVAPGATATFTFKLKGNTVGAFTQTFAMVEEGKTWFADQGGPPDNFITVKVNVTAKPVSTGTGGGGGSISGTGGGASGAGGGGGDANPDELSPPEPITLPWDDGTLPASQGGANGGCAAVPGGPVLWALFALARRRAGSRAQ